MQFAGVLETLLVSFKSELNGLVQTTEPTKLSGSKRPRVLEQSPESSAKRIASDSSIGLWARLARKIDIVPRELNVSVNDVGSNQDGVGCARRSAIGVRMLMADIAGKVYLHANKIVFSRGGLQAEAAGASRTPSRNIAEAGQSPQEFRLCERFLVQGLDSERGLFQFVSPEANQFPHLSAEKTIIDQLHQRWNDSGLSKNTLILGGRYLVTDFKECRTEQNDYRRIQLSAVDMANPGKLKTIFLTQAGLRFDDNRLRSREIARADALMESHKGTTGSEAQDPMVISYAGIGRNAALICYREAVQNLGPIRNEEELDALLEKIVADGRRDRGAGFIHSEAQLEELRGAVLERYCSSAGAAGAAMGATSIVERDLTSINA